MGGLFNLIKMRYSDKQNEFIISNYEMMSDKQMASILKRSEQGVKVHRERLGFTRSRKDAFNRFNRLNSIRVEIIALNTIIEKGILVDLASARLDQLVESYGGHYILPNTKNKISKLIKVKAYELHKKGLSNPEISKALNVSRNSVWRWINTINPYSGKNPSTITLQSKV